MCRKYALDSRRENLRQECGHFFGIVRAAGMYRERTVVKSALTMLAVEASETSYRNEEYT
jgi:hypothetical protein